MKNFLLLFAVLLVILTSCKKPTQALTAPEISFTGISDTQVFASNVEDSFLLITLRYTIATSALGDDENPTRIIIQESRENFNQPISYPTELMTAYSDDNQDVNISGEISLFQPTHPLIVRPTRPNGDTTHFIIYLEDKDGKQSNIVRTPDIYLFQ